MLGAGCVFWYLQLQPVDSNQTKVIFELHHGAFKKIAQELQQKGIIKSARAFTLYARAMRAVKDVKMGEYELSSSQSAKEVLSAITSGTSITYDVTFQEGLSMFEIAQILASKKLINEKKFLDLCKDKTFVHSVLGVDRPSLEGYLFPETYKLTKFTGEEEILKTMVAKFKGVISEIQPELWNKKEELHKIIILASIIEKETGADFERSKVASVFYNRIQKKCVFNLIPQLCMAKNMIWALTCLILKKMTF